MDAPEPSPASNPPLIPPPNPAPSLPPDPPMVPFAIAGIAAWAVIGLALLPFRDSLEGSGRGSWIWICLAGFLWGFPGLITMIRHDAGRRQRKAAEGP